MNIYKELDAIISDYVGYDEETGDCRDADLYNCIVHECTMHLDGNIKLTYLSKDTQICIKEWEGTCTETWYTRIQHG